MSEIHIIYIADIPILEQNLVFCSNMGIIFDKCYKIS